MSCEHYHAADLCCECAFYVSRYGFGGACLQSWEMGWGEVEGEGGGVVEVLEVGGLEMAEVDILEF